MFFCWKTRQDNLNNCLTELFQRFFLYFLIFHAARQFLLLSYRFFSVYFLYIYTRQDNFANCLTMLSFSCTLSWSGKTISLIVVPSFEPARQSAWLSYRVSKPVRQSKQLSCLPYIHSSPSSSTHLPLHTYLHALKLKFLT